MPTSAEDSTPEDAIVVLSSISPNGNVEAYVEQDERVVHFYLHGAPDTGFPVKSCWVRKSGSRLPDTGS